MDKGDAARQTGAKAQAVIGAGDVVVDGFGDGNNRRTLAAELDRKSQRIVIADHDQGAVIQALDHVQNMGGAIQAGSAAAQTLWDDIGRRVARVQAGGMQERAGAAVDGAHHVLCQFDKVLAVGGGLQRVIADQTLPAFAHADGFVAQVDQAVDQAFQTHVETRHIAAAGENCNTFTHTLLLG